MSSIKAMFQDFSAPEKQHVDDHDHGNNLLTVVDTSGMHILAILPCKCPNHAPFQTQLLDVGLYSSTQKLPRMAFTFQVLDAFRLMNLECKVTAMSFNKYLRQITNPGLPNTSPNKLTFGFSNAGKTQPKEGNLAYFCPACPQPGINLPENWVEDLQGAWKYNRSFVMDGNFSAKHMKMKADMDFNFTQGSGYYTAVPRYKEHLQIADDCQLKSTCHEHKVVNQVHVIQKHLVATGIGAIAFVDFQKGK
ncbi:hypothetical protein BS17DRAFT_796665 [Gyrodon lividus]|nr:hypothetical protein BS17DRAFT_796665 [Gyrodon lividus]